MTCVVGMINRGNVYIGADSAGVAGYYNIVDRSDKKVFRNGEMIMGFTSSFRMGQLLRYKLSLPKHQPEVGIMSYMVVHFVDAVRELFKESGFTTINNSKESGGIFLVGYRGRLFSIEDDFQVGETRDGIAACGCGRDYALGAMRGSNIIDPLRRIRTALKAAEYYSAGVRGPFFFETLKGVPKRDILNPARR